MKDIILVLGGGINSDGSLPDIPKARVDEGVRLFKKEEARRLIMTGKYGSWLDEVGSTPPKSEAAAMKEYATSLGIPAGDILLEEESRDTIGNAVCTLLNVLTPNNFRSIVVVTSDFHILRTQYIFDFLLGPNFTIVYVGVTSNLSGDQIELLQIQEKEILEITKQYLDTTIVPGDILSIVNWFKTTHPTYLSQLKTLFK